MSMSLLHDSNIGWAKGRERQCQKIKVCSYTSMTMNKYYVNYGITNYLKKIYNMATYKKMSIHTM